MGRRHRRRCRQQTAGGSGQDHDGLDTTVAIAFRYRQAQSKRNLLHAGRLNGFCQSWLRHKIRSGLILSVRPDSGSDSDYSIIIYFWLKE